MTTIEELLGYMDDCNPDVLERRAEYLQGTDAEG